MFIISKGTTKRDMKEILGISSFKKMGDLSIGWNRTKEFSHIKYQVQKRLAGWSRQVLSKTGKMVLIKSIIQAIPTYTMATFKVLDGICKSLDSATRKFLWSSKSTGEGFLALRAWDDICKLKLQGGLGFRKFSDINSLFDPNWPRRWRMERTLWIRIMRAK